MTLELTLLALFCGFLGGMGGRFAVLWQLRKDMSALAAAVDPALASKLGTLSGEVLEQANTVDALASTLKTLQGKVAQERKPAPAQLTAEDLDLVVGTVLTRLQQAQRVRSAG